MRGDFNVSVNASRKLSAMTIVKVSQGGYVVFEEGWDHGVPRVPLLAATTLDEVLKFIKLSMETTDGEGENKARQEAGRSAGCAATGS